MRVALDLRVLDDPALGERGIGRYARELAAALAPAADVDVAELRGLRRPRTPARVAELWEHALLGRDARRTGADLLHSPSVDLATTRAGLPYVVTLHDLVPLKDPDEYLRTGLKHRLRYAAVKRATRVIVPSQAVADDAARMLGIENVDVIPEAPAPVVPAGDGAARPAPAPAPAAAVRALGRRPGSARPAQGRRTPRPRDRRRRRAAARAGRPPRRRRRGARRRRARGSRGPSRGRGARRPLLRGRRARPPIARRGLRPDGARGARVRHAGRGLPPAGAVGDARGQRGRAARPARGHPRRCWPPRRSWPAWRPRVRAAPGRTSPATRSRSTPAPSRASGTGGGGRARRARPARAPGRAARARAARVGASEAARSSSAAASA